MTCFFLYSGWTTKSLPYIVELDNYDCTVHPGVQDPKDTFHPFGWDEISWFAHQPSEYRFIPAMRVQLIRCISVTTRD